MFIELITVKGEKLTLNTQHIVLVAPTRKGTVLVDVNGIDWEVSEGYESLKEKLECSEK
ncbi:MAG: hypothetical protein IKC72_00945 [Clostridia bacterium]|nr:hypothetical protein [Clostridia bacterium]